MCLIIFLFVYLDMKPYVNSNISSIKQLNEVCTALGGYKLFGLIGILYKSFDHKHLVHSYSYF